MASRNPTLLVLALGLTLTACATGGASTSAPASSSSPSPTPSVTAAPSVSATASPTAVPAPTYPANVMDVPGDDFSPLEVETYFIEPVGDGHPGLLHDSRGRLAELDRHSSRSRARTRPISWSA